MMESMKIILLYKNAHKAKIEEKYRYLLEKARENITIFKEFDDMINAYKQSIYNFYISQFEKEEDINDNVIVASKPIAMHWDCNFKDLDMMTGIMYKNDNFETEEEKQIKEDKKKELLELDELCAACSAMLGICTKKEEIESVLLRYDIINKKGKINL